MNRFACMRAMRLGAALALAAWLLSGCITPEGYSDWQWKQYNPEYRPLPGDPHR